MVRLILILWPLETHFRRLSSPLVIKHSSRRLADSVAPVHVKERSLIFNGKSIFETLAFGMIQSRSNNQIGQLKTHALLCFKADNGEPAKEQGTFSAFSVVTDTLILV